MSATLQGLKDAIADPQQAGVILNKYQRQIDVDIAAGETKIVGTLVGQPLGALDPGRVKKTVEIVGDAFSLKSPVAPADIYAPGFVAN